VILCNYCHNVVPPPDVVEVSAHDLNGSPFPVTGGFRLHFHQLCFNDWFPRIKVRQRPGDQSSQTPPPAEDPLNA
jgi:hypothetical protein